MAYAEDEPENDRKGWHFNGTDLSKIPCFRDSFFYSILSGMLVGVSYNLLTSRAPYKLAFGTYSAVLFGYWGVCRYNYRMSEAQMKQLRMAMANRAVMEGTKKDNEWKNLNPTSEA